MLNGLRWLFWLVCYLLRFVLIIFGALVPIHIGYNTPRTKGLNIFERYWENSIRNPTPYLRGLLKQPVPEVHPNPDKKVRAYAGKQKATRLMVHGPYIEYWTLERRNNKKRPFFEKRIGWKFVDGEETFWPTFQFHPSK